MNHLNFLKACLFILLSARSGSLQAQQVADTGFIYKVNNPVYKTGSGPVITVDEAHFNFHTITGRYYSLGKILKDDGYIVERGLEKITPGYLLKSRIFIIANAIADTAGDGRLPTRSAFTTEEITVIKDWVNDGGRLFLIADHMPFAGAVSKLARSFGFNIVNGYAFRIDEQTEMFSRAQQNLLDNVITRGGNSAERIDSIEMFTGNAFLIPPAAKPITTLKDDYEILTPIVPGEFNDSTPGFRGKYFVNSAMLQYGKGRIILFGEAGLFSAQFQGPERSPMGMNHSFAKQNPQFLLNIIHWLDGKLN